MKVTYLESAALLIEDETTKVLCDPWLVDGAYYGSWCHYPPPPFSPEDFNDVDYIYISHVHPDHCCGRTMARLDRDIPVIIHDYRWDYLREKIESWGFEVLEFPHNERIHLKNDMHMNVLAADGCDPKLCGNFFGCDWFDDTNDGSGTTQVDTMAVIDNGDYTVVDTNDCPYPMAKHPCREIKNQYGSIDLLCHQYSAAQFYPQSMRDYSHEEKLAAAADVIHEKYQLAENFVELFKPNYYMPFAGEYVLGGKLSHLNPYTANPPRIEALEYFSSHIDSDQSECVFLNSGEHIDLSTGRRSAPFRPRDPENLQQYIDTVLSKRKFTYEKESEASKDELLTYLPDAYDRLEERRANVGFESDTRVLISFPDDAYLELSMNGDGYELKRDIDHQRLASSNGYVQFDLDPRLLRWLMRGDHHAHWADAKIGSHLGVRKRPDIYERGLYNTMGSFYASP